MTEGGVEGNGHSQFEAEQDGAEGNYLSSPVAKKV
jgi:hypothetical protein